MERLLDQVMRDPRIRHAAADARASDELTIADQISLCEVPAPPFGEGLRGRVMADRFQALGLSDVGFDEAGNVLALRPATTSRPPIVLSAHLDTVFADRGSVSVLREGDTLRAPGISDDARGLAVLLAVGRALNAARILTVRPVLLAATVGEEGVGNLRGSLHLMGRGGAGREAGAFISVDGAGLDRVVTRGLGSRRFRITVRGPGGHSWTDRGLVNPIHALGRVVAALPGRVRPSESTSALTVARWGGGTGVNAIPQEAWVEVDVRSESVEVLELVERDLRRTVSGAIAEEEATHMGGLTVHVEQLGVRPGGATPSDAPLVRAAVAATRAVGAEPVMALASTDANAAMAVGIPAITLGGGGEAGLAHTTAEWYRNTKGPEGVLRALYTLLLVAGVAD
jgi:acetylornithine deacetylase/succinyl-diaminopimelate desuccinylase-like protein